MAKSVFVLVFTVVTASLNSARGLSNTTWDFFVFSELSPGGDYYMKNGLNCSRRSDILNLTMHGIWPSTWSGEDNPSYCKDTTFDVTKVMDLLPQLMKVWPTLAPPDPSHWDHHCSNNRTQYMWCHEWLKHGTCATGITKMSTERGFFSEVLKLFQERMNYDKFVLSKYGIHPSTTHSYQLKDFVSAFNNAWKVNPIILCNTKDDRQVLDSIRTCMDKTFRLMQCPDHMYNEDQCDSRDPIFYYPASCLDYLHTLQKD